MHNNFSNGTRCLPVNGWFVALHQKQDGRKDGRNGDNELAERGLVWHSYSPSSTRCSSWTSSTSRRWCIFTARYLTNSLRNVVNRWVSSRKA